MAPSFSSRWASRSTALPRQPVSRRRGSAKSSAASAITTDTALRLSKALGVDDRFWINIQTDYDLEIERDRHGAELGKVIALVAN